MPRRGCRRPTSSCCWWWRPVCLFGFWMPPVSAAAWTCGLLCIHTAIIRSCGKFLAEPPSLTATRKWRTRFVLLDLLYGLCWTAILIHPASFDAVSNTLMMFLMLLVIAVSSMLAASLPDRSTCGHRSGDVGDCGEFRAERHVRQLRAGVARAGRRRIFRAARPPPAFDDAGDAGGARRKGRADRRTRAGESRFRTRRATARKPPTSRSRGFWRK